jgi:hypothetical protein
MTQKELRNQIREEMRANQAARDDLTKRLQDAIDRYRARLGPIERRESS